MAISLSGSLEITGSIYATGGITGSFSGTATSASYALIATSASYAANSDLLDGRDSLTFANTGSNAFVGTQNINGAVAITGSLTTTGAITAQTLNVQQVTSSIVYSSGSNIFGNSVSNTQSMTGSVGISGSLAVVGAATFTGTTGDRVTLYNSGNNSSINGLKIDSDIYPGITFNSRASTGGAVIGGGKIVYNAVATGYGAASLGGAILLQADNAMQFSTGGDNVRATITSGGNVGIGETSPTSKLTISAPDSTNSWNSTNPLVTISNLDQNGTEGNTLLVRGGALSTSSYIINAQDYSGNSKFYVRGDGNVGIGTTSTYGKLTVLGDSNVATFTAEKSSVGEYSGISIASRISGGDIWYASEIRNINTQSAPATLEPRLGFFTQNPVTYLPADRSEKMSILGNGNVGIGTTTPGKTLEIYQAGSNTAQFKIGDASVSKGYLGVFSNALYITSGGTYSGSWSTDGSNGISSIVMETSNGGSAIAFGTASSNTSPTERMRITSTGITLINTSTSSGYGVLNTYKLPVDSTYVDQIIVQGTGNYPSLRLGTFGAYDGVIATTGNDLRILSGLNVTTEDHDIRFYTCFNGCTTGAQNYERMRITSGGNVLIGRTDSAAGNVGAKISSNGFIEAVVSNEACFSANRKDATGVLMIFQYQNSTKGTISTDGTNTAYNTSSDYRLKENLKPINGLEKLSKINVYDFKWKDSDLRMDGVLAHELQEIIPYAVQGEKDAIDKDGNILPQGVDYSKLVPIMIKAIQEQQSQIEALKLLIK
jgi:hypothetical protein